MQREIEERQRTLKKRFSSLSRYYRGATPEQVALALLSAGHAKARRRHRRRLRWRLVLRFLGLAQR